MIVCIIAIIAIYRRLQQVSCKGCMSKFIQNIMSDFILFPWIAIKRLSTTLSTRFRAIDYTNCLGEML